MFKIEKSSVTSTSLWKCLICFFTFHNITMPIMSQSDPNLLIKAQTLSQKFTLVDGHIDLPLRLHEAQFENDEKLLREVYSTTKGDFDLLRAREGGLNGAFMAVYIPADYQKSGGAKQLADSVFQYLETITRLQPELYQMARNPQDVTKGQKTNQFSIMAAIENGEAIEDDLNHLQHFKNKGLTYMTLCHGKDNRICDSSYDDTQTWKGVSDFGYKVLDEMQRLGIMIDVSHISDNAFFQVAQYVKVPLVATHSSCRKFTPGFERNVSDEIIKEIARTNGVVMVTFGSTFLEGDIAVKFRERRQKYKTLIQENNLTLDSEAEINFRKDFDTQFPPIFADVSHVADHIDHIVSLVGIEHVGLGSDFDGVGDSLPTGLKDVSGYPNIIFHLLKRGYSDEDIKKICSDNLFRVWNEVLDYGLQK